MRQFWMVWNENNRDPRHKHDTEDSARKEAERLARQLPGSVFHVLVCIDSCRINDVIWVSKQHDPMEPF